MTAASISTGERGIFFGLILLVFALPIPFGSNVPWIKPLIGIAISVLFISWIALCMTGRVNIPTARLSENRWPICLWVLWLCWVLFQIVPLPFPLVEVLSPMAAMHYMSAFPDAAQLRWPLSIDSGRTHNQLLLSFSFFLLYMLVLLLVGMQRRLAQLAGAIVIAGVLQAVYGSIMVLSGLEYGFFIKKVAYLGRATGTFINANHLAGYLEISAAVGIGLIVADLRGKIASDWRQRLRNFTELVFSRRLRVRVLVSLMVIAIVLTRSRMGNTAFFVSLMACGTLYILLRERRLLLKSILLFASFLVIDLFIVSNWFGLEKVVERIEQTPFSADVRASIAPELARAVDAYWLTGAGLGTFSTAFLPFRVSDPMFYYDHAHNDYAEFMIEVGIIGCLLLSALVLVTVVHALRVMAGRRDRMKTGVALAAFMALTAMALHSTVDFNLQIPANAATLVVLMAMVNSCSHQSESKSMGGGKMSEIDDEDLRLPGPITQPISSA